MTDRLRIVKMSGAGNDFVVLGPDGIERVGPDPFDWVRRVCRRGLSVGADGVLLVDPVGANRIRVRFYNPDGSPAFCGNGTRCAARFARMRGLAEDEMMLETAVGEVPAEVAGDRVRLVLPPPRSRGRHEVAIGHEKIEGDFIVAGVPHFVVFVESVATAPLERWGPLVRKDPRFGTAGTNFDVVAQMDDGRLALRTWERGVEGETLACGSGAVAAAFAARLRGAGETPVVVPASGVPLEIRMSGPADGTTAAELIGDARVVFEGELSDEAVSGFPSHG